MWSYLIGASIGAGVMYYVYPLLQGNTKDLDAEVRRLESELEEQRRRRRGLEEENNSLRGELIDAKKSGS